MNPLHRFLPLTLATIALAVLPAPAGAESAVAQGGGSASATVQLQVVVLPVLRLLANAHPATVTPQEGQATTVEQRVVVMTNMRHGFCLDLRKDAAAGLNWRVNAVNGDGVDWMQTADGYRLCGLRPGRYDLVLQHAFESTTARASAGPLRWPVETALNAI